MGEHETMTELIEKAIAEISKLPEQQQDELATWILEKLSSPDLRTEAEWEEDVLDETLGAMLRADGSVDFDKLRSGGQTLSLDELYPEGSSEDEA
jgi:hypothetical protein